MKIEQCPECFWNGHFIRYLPLCLNVVKRELNELDVVESSDKKMSFAKADEKKDPASVRTSSLLYYWPMMLKKLGMYPLLQADRVPVSHFLEAETSTVQVSSTKHWPPFFP